MEESIKSEFNAGVGQTIRVSNLQDRINLVSINLLLFNDMYNCYNYEFKFNILRQLLNEVYPKLTSDEKKEGKVMADTITSFLDKHKVFVEVKSKVDGKSETRVDYPVWIILRKYLHDFEIRVYEFLDIHEMNSPNKDWDDGL